MPTQQVPSSRGIELLREQIAGVEHGPPSDLDAWVRMTRARIRRAMGADHWQVAEFDKVDYSPMVLTASEPEEMSRRAQKSGTREAVSILAACIDERQDDSGAARQRSVPETEGRAFIVHGHDEGAKHETARFLRDLLGSEPIILHEERNSGQTLLEKFEANAATSGYAVVLLTGDDLGRAKGAAPKKDMPRGRQNVILELGFFLGAIGRAKVTVLRDPGVEIPTDVLGFAYVERDSAGAWKATLAREIEGAGFDVDWSALG